MELENETAVKRPAPQTAQRDVKPSTWPDAWLISAIRRDPPDEEALNALVDRYWKKLYARCRMLTVDPDSANDLAQESWLRMASLDAPVAADEGESIPLFNVVADPHTLSADDQILLEMDLDNALSRLEPRLRDVLISRFITGESAAEIGQRYGRTEQSITGWIREATQQMKIYLGDERSRDRNTEGR